jgi:hypothetical protein
MSRLHALKALSCLCLIAAGGLSLMGLASQPVSKARPSTPHATGKAGQGKKPFVIQETYRETTPAQQEKGIVGLDMLINPGHYPVVQRVFKGTPAALQGIRVGDVIMAINGVRAVNKSLWEVDTLISDVPGDVVTITILRGSNLRKVPLTVMSLSEANAQVRNNFAGLIP